MDGAKDATVRLAIKSAHEFPIAKTIYQRPDISWGSLTAPVLLTCETDNRVAQAQYPTENLRRTFGQCAVADYDEE